MRINVRLLTYNFGLNLAASASASEKTLTPCSARAARHRA